MPTRSKRQRSAMIALSRAVNRAVDSPLTPKLGRELCDLASEVYASTLPHVCLPRGTVFLGNGEWSEAELRNVDKLLAIAFSILSGRQQDGGMGYWPDPPDTQLKEAMPAKTTDDLLESEGRVETFDRFTGSGTVSVGTTTVEFSIRCFYATPVSRPPRIGERVSVLFSPSPDTLLSVRAGRE